MVRITHRERLKVRVRGSLASWSGGGKLLDGFHDGMFGEELAFTFSTNGKLVGMWNVLKVRNGVAYTSDLKVRKGFRGRGYGQMIVAHVLRHIYEKYKIKEVRTIVSTDKKYTDDFPIIKNLLVKIGYEIAKIGDDGKDFVLILSGRNYEKFISEGIKEKSREELEKIWRGQLRNVSKR